MFGLFAFVGGTRSLLRSAWFLYATRTSRRRTISAIRFGRVQCGRRVKAVCKREAQLRIQNEIRDERSDCDQFPEHAVHRTDRPPGSYCHYRPITIVLLTHSLRPLRELTTRKQIERRRRCL